MLWFFFCRTCALCVAAPFVCRCAVFVVVGLRLSRCCSKVVSVCGKGHKDDCGKDKGLPFSNPKPAAVVAARKTGMIDDGVYLDRLTEQELHTWNNLAYWTENEKNLLQELWKTFERDGQIPIEDPESRSVREMFKWLGSQPAFHWLAPYGQGLDKIKKRGKRKRK
jgi:hypothetical protein